MAATDIEKEIAAGRLQPKWSQVAIDEDESFVGVPPGGAETVRSRRPLTRGCAPRPRSASRHPGVATRTCRVRTAAPG